MCSLFLVTLLHLCVVFVIQFDRIFKNLFIFRLGLDFPPGFDPALVNRNLPK